MGHPLPDRLPRTMPELKALAKVLGVPKKHLLVMAESNDPFNVDRPAAHRDAEWFMQQWERYGDRSEGYLHGLHYVLESAGDVTKPDGTTYENTVEDETFLVVAAMRARYLKKLDPLVLVDKRAQRPQINIDTPDEPYDPPEPTWTAKYGDDDLLELGNMWKLPEIDSFADTFEVGEWRTRLDEISVYSDDVGRIEVDGYGYSPHDQPFLLWQWIEKGSMTDYLGPICRELGANYSPAAGFSSHTRIIETLQVARRHGKPFRLFTVSDFGTGGNPMPVAMARNVEFYRDWYAPEVEIVHFHVGITKAWVDELNLPRKPFKAKDRRAANFAQRFGEGGGVELDALKVLHPGLLEHRVRQAMAPYVDLDLPRRLRQTRSDTAAGANAAWLENTAEVSDELSAVRREVITIRDRSQLRMDELAGQVREAISEAIAPFEEQWDQLVEDYDEQVTPLRDRLDAAWINLQDHVAEVQIELPDRPTAEVEIPNEGHALYDTRRNVLDQLDAYHEYQRVSLDVPTAVCEQCHEEFERGRADQRFCTRPDCRRERRKAQWHRNKPDRTRVCRVCGDEFQYVSRPTEQECPKLECRRERNRRIKRESAARRKAAG